MLLAPLQAGVLPNHMSVLWQLEGCLLQQAFQKSPDNCFIGWLHFSCQATPDVLWQRTC